MNSLLPKSSLRSLSEVEASIVAVFLRALKISERNSALGKISTRGNPKHLLGALRQEARLVSSLTRNKVYPMFSNLMFSNLTTGKIFSLNRSGECQIKPWTLVSHLFPESSEGELIYGLLRWLWTLERRVSQPFLKEGCDYFEVRNRALKELNCALVKELEIILASKQAILTDILIDDGDIPTDLLNQAYEIPKTQYRFEDILSSINTDLTTARQAIQAIAHNTDQLVKLQIPG